MIPRLHGVSIAWIALLTVAPVCFAQDPTLPPLTPAAPDSVPAPGAAAATPAVAKPTPMHLAKRGSFGGSLGWGAFPFDADYAFGREAGGFGNRDTRSRAAFGAVFRYQASPWLRWQISPAYSWTGYQKDSPIPFTDINYPADRTKEHILAQMLPVSFQLQLTKQRGGWLYHAGGGPGLYYVWIENRRKVLADPVSLKRHAGWYPGASGEIGAARFLKSLPSVSIEGVIDAHWAFAERDEQFPSGFNSFVAWMSARVGASYHFDPRRLVNPPSKSPASAIPAGR